MEAMAPYQLQGDVFAGRLRLLGQGDGPVVGSGDAMRIPINANV